MGKEGNSLKAEMRFMHPPITNRDNTGKPSPSVLKGNNHAEQLFNQNLNFKLDVTHENSQQAKSLTSF